jgi:hypothetical protein
VVNLQPVASSNISGVGYDDTTHTLMVAFKGGARYAYKNVPSDVADDLRTAVSPGQFFYDNIRDVYPYVRV